MSIKAFALKTETQIMSIKAFALKTEQRKYKDDHQLCTIKKMR
jgi:hypothetical protein